MAYKPDYGLRLLHDGVTPLVDQYFYDFRLNSLIVLGGGQYSTMVDLPFAGELHAMSLDFNQDQLNKIIAKATPRLAAYIQAELKQDPNTPRAIDFDGDIAFGVRARLGQLQQVQRESFVPLVAREIM